RVTPLQRKFRMKHHIKRKPMPVAQKDKLPRPRARKNENANKAYQQCKFDFFNKVQNIRF
ncbi:MAG: hypothetical protein J6U06_04255, partial [Spirochaetaceae bacterium]|nr:hypothetical protein [Spirochaetaceae bacterium]